MGNGLTLVEISCSGSGLFLPVVDLYDPEFINPRITVGTGWSERLIPQVVNPYLGLSYFQAHASVTPPIVSGNYYHGNDNHM